MHFLSTINLITLTVALISACPSLFAMNQIDNYLVDENNSTNASIYEAYSKTLHNQEKKELANFYIAYSTDTWSEADSLRPRVLQRAQDAGIDSNSVYDSGSTFAFGYRYSPKHRFEFQLLNVLGASQSSSSHQEGLFLASDYTLTQSVDVSRQGIGIAHFIHFDKKLYALDPYFYYGIQNMEIDVTDSTSKGYVGHISDAFWGGTKVNSENSGSYDNTTEGFVGLGLMYEPPGISWLFFNADAKVYSSELAGGTESVVRLGLGFQF